MKKIIILSVLSVAFVGCGKGANAPKNVSVSSGEQFSGKMEGHKVDWTCIPKSISSGEPTLVATLQIPEDENDAYKFQVERKVIKGGKVESSEMVSENPVILNEEDGFKNIHQILEGSNVSESTLGALNTESKSITLTDGSVIECDNLKGGK